MIDSEYANRQIYEIQKEFEEIVKQHFSDLWSQFNQNELSAEKNIANYLKDSSDVIIVKGRRRPTAILWKVEALIEDTDNFWNRQRVHLQKAISDSNRLSILIGDIDGVSKNYEDSLLKLGLYFDTVYAIDPLSIIAQRIRKEPNLLSGERYILTIVRLLLGYLHVRDILNKIPLNQDDIVLAFVPILGFEWGSKTFDKIFDTATNHTNTLLSNVFQEEIQEPYDVLEKTKSITIQKFEDKLRDDPATSILLQDFQSIHEYMKAHKLDYMTQKAKSLHANYNQSFDKINIYPDIQSRMLSLESSEIFATCLGIDASDDISKHRFNVFRVNQNQNCSHKIGLRQEEIVSHALLKGELNWLLPDSYSQLLSLRKFNSLIEIREIFNINRRYLQKASPENKQTASEEMVNSVYTAIQKAIEDLNYNRKRGLIKEAINIVKVVSSIGMAALTSIFNMPLATNIAVAALIPTYSVRDIKQSLHQSFIKEQESLKRPAFLLLNIAKRKEVDKKMPLLPNGQRPSDYFFNY